MIDRYYTGFLEGLKKWPKEWPAWGHFDKVVRSTNGKGEFDNRNKKLDDQQPEVSNGEIKDQW